MSKDQRKNSEGYQDITAYEAMKRCKDPQRQIQGSHSRAIGKHFENMITVACLFYGEKNIAHIEKTPEPMKVLRSMPLQHGKFVACFEKSAQPDYKGTLLGGKAIVFEAKHTDNDRIERGRVTQEQIDGLEKHHKLGALAFVFVSFKFQSFYRIPWIDWRDMKDLYGRKYLKADELDNYRISAPGGVIKLLSGIV